MVFSVMYTSCNVPQLDAQRSQSAIFANCQYDIIRQH